ncbi:MAG: hypothetical protein IJ754_03910 [Bacteroidaceae bacterium]|nr:hypothetical protein [Bacteroidaceae bacterium]MBR1790883.1 hypothetical protein [Bacteroidaceae bacterium]
MKKLLLVLTLVLACQAVKAQDAPAQHLLFEGVEMKGDIYDFSKVLQKQGYKQRQRDLNQLFFVFKGNLLGHPEQFRVNFSKKTKTVWRIMAQPHNVPLDELVDSLTARYGEPYEAISTSFKWQLPVGFILLEAHEGYDPNLVFMDAAGVAAFKDEDNRN